MTPPSDMVSRHRLAEVASLLADPRRAAMCGSLMDGRSLPAGELARAAGVTASTASSHLAKLEASGLVVAQAVGRHRYFRLGGPEVAEALEGLARLIPRGGVKVAPTSASKAALQHARLCYDHLAGALGVAVTHALVERKALALDLDGLALGPRANATLAQLGVDLDAIGAGARPLIRTCIDWTERRQHVAGSLGAAIANEFLEREWVRRQRGTRALVVTTRGQRELVKRLALDWR
ncbi:MAG TPA: winged helix-turn-helix domain-containing protein [Myxococcota bacterium]|nr:winged helix-turn-helix domain-containing protein [Myxococcota bacterium]